MFIYSLLYEKGNASEVMNWMINILAIINQFMHSSDKKVAPGYHYILCFDVP